MALAATLPLLAAGASGALGHASEPIIPWLRIVLAFVFCAALALAAILAIRRRHGSPGDWRSLMRGLVEAPSNPPARVLVEERIRLSATSQIVVLRWAAARYLVHIAPGGAQLLDRQTAAEDA